MFSKYTFSGFFSVLHLTTTLCPFSCCELKCTEHNINKMLTKLVQVLLTIICSIIFAYYAHQSVMEYLSYKTVSKQNRERQEDQLMPQICVSSPSLAMERLQKLGLTGSKYTEEGIWRSNHQNYSTASEDEIKRMVFPNLTDILHNIEVDSRSGKYSDQYIITEYRTDQILNGADVKIVKLDYYAYFSIFCLSFPSSSFPFGVEKIRISIKRKSEVFVVAPGNFYSFERKRNLFRILAGQNYLYQVLSAGSKAPLKLTRE